MGLPCRPWRVGLHTISTYRKSPSAYEEAPRTRRVSFRRGISSHWKSSSYPIRRSPELTMPRGCVQWMLEHPREWFAQWLAECSCCTSFSRPRTPSHDSSSWGSSPPSGHPAAAQPAPRRSPSYQRGASACPREEWGAAEAIPRDV